MLNSRKALEKIKNIDDLLYHDHISANESEFSSLAKYSYWGSVFKEFIKTI